MELLATIGSISYEETIIFYSANIYSDTNTLLLNYTTNKSYELDVSAYDTVYIEVSAILNSSGAGAYRAIAIKDIYY